VQSPAAGALLASLGGDLAAATSKSHSRAVVAAAIGNTSSIRLGIDVEWMSPDRPFTAIMQAFVPSLLSPLDGDSFYRGWTFLEAYYKAFQQLPCPRDIEKFIAVEAKQTPHQIENGSWVQQQNVFESFKLCLVWKSSDLCVVEHLPCGAMIDTTDRQT
jgi:hypothetical protein